MLRRGGFLGKFPKGNDDLDESVDKAGESG